MTIPVPTSLAELASRITTNLDESRVAASIVELEHQNDAPQESREFQFQYYPENIQVSKQKNMAPKEIIGGSFPLYQWTSSGERTITFSTYFTCDIDLLVNGEAGVQDLLRRVQAAGIGDRNIDIRVALLFLARFQLPTFSGVNASGSQLTLAPRKLKLRLPGSAIGSIGGEVHQSSIGVSKDEVVCHMTQFEYTYEAHFPSGLPRIVAVQLGFAQNVQVNGGVQFPHAGNSMDKIALALQTSGYAVKRRGIRG